MIEPRREYRPNNCQSNNKKKLKYFLIGYQLFGITWDNGNVTSRRTYLNLRIFFSENLMAWSVWRPMGVSCRTGTRTSQLSTRVKGRKKDTRNESYFKEKLCYISYNLCFSRTHCTSCYFVLYLCIYYKGRGFPHIDMFHIFCLV